MNRDVFVWLLAVALIGRNIWLADRRSWTDSQQEFLWSRPLVMAWWEAQRARWAEEEARQDAMPAARAEHPRDECAGPDPAPPPEIHPDCEPAAEVALLAWGDPRVRPARRRSVVKYHYVRLGPRGADFYIATAANSGDPDGRFWAP